MVLKVFMFCGYTLCGCSAARPRQLPLAAADRAADSEVTLARWELALVESEAADAVGGSPRAGGSAHCVYHGDISQ